MVSEAKKQLVSELVEDIKAYPIVGVVNLENLPAQQLQTMRGMLREQEVKIRMARKKLLQLALKESQLDHIEDLTAQIKGLPALIFSKSNPFTLYGTIQKNKSAAPAKPGQTAPNDIEVNAGATNFAPGPIISELAAVGIKTKVENGKLAIIDDVIVAKEGDVISAPLAETLKRLDIKPVEIGLNLVAVWENGHVFAAKLLHIDEEEYMQNFSQAAQWAMNLAMEASYLTEETTGLLLQKAFREAKSLALEQDILTDATTEEIIAKSERQALAVKSAAGVDSAPEPRKEEKGEENKEQTTETTKNKESTEETPQDQKQEGEEPTDGKQD
jgi:large subunit ribosomal protein L10